MKPPGDYSDKNVGDIVRSDYRTADVFKAHGINYCCNGNAPLGMVCEQRDIDPRPLYQKLDEAVRITSVPKTIDFNSWRLDFLVDYITHIHHAYLKDSMPALLLNFQQVLNGHRKQYPILEPTYETINELFVLLNTENKRQEEVVFPYVKQIDNAIRRKEPYGKLFVRTLRKPFNVNEDQPAINNLLDRIRLLTGNYQLPETACTSLHVIIHKLREQDHDLVQHKHLENNVLFPRLTEMESELLQS